MSVNNITKTLSWVAYAIRQHNYIGAESVIADMLSRIKAGNLPQADMDHINNNLGGYKSVLVGLIITEFMNKYKISLCDLAEETGLSLQETKQLLNGQLNITPDLAQTIETILGLPPGLFSSGKVPT